MVCMAWIGEILESDTLLIIGFPLLGAVGFIAGMFCRRKVLIQVLSLTIGTSGSIVGLLIMQRG